MDLVKLREQLVREKGRREEHEEVEREMVWTFMHTLMIDPCQLWSRKKPLVLNHLPNHQIPTTKLLVLTHLPSHQSSPSFQSTSRPTASGRDQTPAPVIFPACSFEAFALRPTCLVTLAGSPHPPHQSPDHARDHVLASTIAAAIPSQATNHVLTRRV